MRPPTLPRFSLSYRQKLGSVRTTARLPGLAARLQDTVQAGALTTSPSNASKARSSEAEMQVKIGVSFSV